jgi:magnesium transporter
MMVGIVTYDDAMDVASEEATEDFLKVGAVNASSKLSISLPPFCNFTRNECFGWSFSCLVACFRDWYCSL